MVGTDWVVFPFISGCPDQKKEYCPVPPEAVAVHVADSPVDIVDGDTEQEANNAKQKIKHAIINATKVFLINTLPAVI